MPIEEQTVPQKQFSNLREFMDGLNNFYHFFLEGSQYGRIRRQRVRAYQRYGEREPDFVRELTKETTRMYHEESRVPYEGLFKAYEGMSRLVFKQDFSELGRAEKDDYLLE